MPRVAAMGTALALVLVTAACSGGDGSDARGQKRPPRSTTTTLTDRTSTTTEPTTTSGPESPTTTTRRPAATTRPPKRCGGAPLVDAPAGTVVQVRRCGDDSADYTFGFRVGVFTQAEACTKGVGAVRAAGFRVTRDRCADGTATFSADRIVGTIDTTIPNGTIRVSWILRG